MEEMTPFWALLADEARKYGIIQTTHLDGPAIAALPPEQIELLVELASGLGYKQGIADGHAQAER